MLFYAALIDDPKEQSRFVALYEGYRKQMYYTALRILQDQTLAEDAVHNAFLGIARSMKRVPQGNGDEVRAYVLTCAKNAALTIRWKESRQTQLTQELIEVIPDGASAYEEFEKSEDYERLLKSIRRLSPIYRDVLLMHYVYELDLDEISVKLSRRKATVKSQLFRGKQQLLALYRKEGDPDAEAVSL